MLDENYSDERAKMISKERLINLLIEKIGRLETIEW